MGIRDIRDRVEVFSFAVGFLSNVRRLLAPQGGRHIEEPENARLWRTAPHGEYMTISKEGLLTAFMATFIQLNEPLSAMFLAHFISLKDEDIVSPEGFAVLFTEEILASLGHRATAEQLVPHAWNPNVDRNMHSAANMFFEWVECVRWNESMMDETVPKGKPVPRFSTQLMALSKRTLTPQLLTGVTTLLRDLPDASALHVFSDMLTLACAMEARNVTEHQPVNILALLKAIYAPN